MENITKYKKLFLVIIFFLLPSFPAAANNLNVQNVSLEERNPSTKTVVLEFDVSWDSSWRTKINHDAVWLTVRLYDPTVYPTNKKLCELVTSGVNPTGTSIGTGADVEIDVPSDKKGVFIRPASYGKSDKVEAKDVRLTVDYSSCGFESTNNAMASVFGIEMVYIPEGAFYAGDYDGSAAALDQGSGDSDPWQITSEAVMGISNPVSDGYRYVSAGNTGEDATGATLSLPANFPKGYQGFYVMKYEINEGEWAEFLNSLPSVAARANHDLTDSAHKNSDLVKTRNTISCSGATLACTSDRPARALNYLSWMDVTSFLDWAALRPITELEFEKMARGPVIPVPGEFSFGSANITAVMSLSSGEENGVETVANAGAKVHYGNVVLTGGDAANGMDYAQGPLRGGILATANSVREDAGATYYGVLDVSGNLKEYVVTIGNAFGRDFTGKEGDGVLSTTSGFEGNANQSGWPGLDAITERGVTGYSGTGLRGGSWADSAEKLHVSDRSEAVITSTPVLSTVGGRGAKTHTVKN